MYTMNRKLNQAELEEMRHFMRPFAGSVIVAKSFRNEGESGSGDPGSIGTGDPSVQPNDPWASIDLDTLPEAARAVVVAQRTEFANLQKSALDNKNAAEKAIQAARSHQSRADRLHATLQKHNLSPEGEGHVGTPNPDDAIYNEYFAYYKSEGLDDTQAKTWAKKDTMAHKISAKHIKQDMGGVLVPHLQQVGQLSLDRVFSEAYTSPDLAQALAVPEVAQASYNELSELVAAGGQITSQVLNLSVLSAYGRHQLNPKANQTHMQHNPPVPFAGGSRVSMSPGFHSNPAAITGGPAGKPTAANADTEAAAFATLANMRRGMNVKPPQIPTLPKR